jgi:hypothetical protein
VQDTQHKRYDRGETFWAAAAVTLLGLLTCAVVAACYPIWFS